MQGQTLESLIRLRDEIRRRLQQDPAMRSKLNHQLSQVEKLIDQKQGQRTLFEDL